MAAPATAKRTPYVGGNWKCTGTVASVTALCEGLAKINTTGIEVMVAPVAIQIPLVQSKLPADAYIVASQNVSATKQGAFTGELAADQLADLGLTTTIIGHSERRAMFGDTNAVITEKVKQALAAKLKVVACLGETLEERKENKVEEVCFASLQAIADAIGDNKAAWGELVIAYEPVWAIGTGVACDKEKAQATHASLRKWFSEKVSADVANSIRIIYGGSVKPANCVELIAQPDIDGFLVGGAALKPDTFGPIIKSAQDAASK